MSTFSRVALRLEPLHDRTVPSVSVVQTGGTLTINGDQHANAVDIKDDGTPSGLTVTVDGTDYALTGAVDMVIVQTRSGWDTVSYTLTGDYVGTTRTVEVFLGNGNDTFTADLGHGVDAASILALQVNGGNGKDSIHGDLTVAAASTGSVLAQVQGKNGKDDLGLAVTGDGLSGLSLDASVDGGHGKDTITVTDNVAVVDAAKN
jgi:hypothetical protein